MMTFKALLNVCNLLNKYDVEYVLVGGWAVFLHGYERATRDIDILVASNSNNITKIKKALTSLLPEACSELEHDDVEKNVVVRMVGENMVLDIMSKIGDVDYLAASGDVSVEEIEGVKIPLANVDIMLKLKEGVREIDKKDYIFLLGKKKYLEDKK